MKPLKYPYPANRWYVYVIRVAETTIHKVGISHEPMRRIAGLQNSNHQKLHLIHTTACIDEADARGVEKRIKQNLKRAQIRGEWFDAEIDTILDTIFFALNYPDGFKGIWGDDTWLGGDALFAPLSALCDRKIEIFYSGRRNP